MGQFSQSTIKSPIGRWPLRLSRAWRPSDRWVGRSVPRSATGLGLFDLTPLQNRTSISLHHAKELSRRSHRQIYHRVRGGGWNNKVEVGPWKGVQARLGLHLVSLANLRCCRQPHVAGTRMCGEVSGTGTGLAPALMGTPTRVS